MITTLYLVRHCQCHPSPEIPENNWPLSERGYAQAQSLVTFLSVLAVDAIYSSPYRRCIETLAPSSAHLGLSIQTDLELRERLISPVWIGDFRDVWRRSWEDFSYALDGGESSFACRDRVTAAIDRIVRKHSGQTVVVGSHGNALALLLSKFTSEYGIKDASALRTPELLRVTHGPEGYCWHRSFEAPTGFDLVASDFRETPGIIAG